MNRFTESAVDLKKPMNTTKKMKYKIHKPVDRSEETNNRIDKEKDDIILMNKKYRPVDDFDFERELIRIFDDIRYKFPPDFNVVTNINGLLIGFIFGIVLSILILLVFKKFNHGCY